MTNNEIDTSDLDEFEKSMNQDATENTVASKATSNAEQNKTTNEVDVSDLEEFDQAKEKIATVRENYVSKIDTAIKTNIDKMFDMNIQAIDKAVEANPEYAFIGEAKKAENELKRAKEYDKAYKEQKSLERIAEAEQTGEASAVDVGSRVLKNMDDVSMQVGQNLLAPVLEKIGADDTAKEIRMEAEKAARSLANVNALYKDIYGEDAWDIAGATTRTLPNIAVTAASGGRTIPEAIGQTVLEYGKTGDAKSALISGTIDATLGKVADIAFAKDAKKVFSKEVEALPEDEKENVKKALETMYDMNIQHIDRGARQKLLREIDFSKPSEQITKDIQDRFAAMKDTERAKVTEAYKLADEQAMKSDDTPIHISEIRQMLTDKNIVKDKNVIKSLKSIKDTVSATRKESGKTDLNAFELEGILSSLKANQRTAEGRGAAAYGEAIAYFTDKQKQLVGDIYEAPRAMSMDFKTKFEGTISDKGVDTGKIVGEMLEKKKTFGESKRLLGENFGREKVNDLLQYKELTPDIRTDMVKDVLVGDTPLDNLDTKEGIDGIISRWSNADHEGLKLMLGKDYNKMSKQIGALALVQNTLNLPSEKKNVLEAAGKFIMNGSMVGISPVSAGKGMVYEGKNMVTALAFRKKATEIKQSLKVFKDDGTIKSTKVYNSMMRALNTMMATVPVEKAFGSENTVNQYNDKKIRMKED